MTARDIEKANYAAELLKQHKLDIYPKALDVTNEKKIEEMALWVKEIFGKIDFLVNNAGINPIDYAVKSKMFKAFYLKDMNANSL